MFRDLFKRIADFFKSIFGKPTPPPVPVPVKPPPVTPDPVPTPSPDDISDASEVMETDTITISDSDTLIVVVGPAEPAPPVPIPIEPAPVDPPIPPKYMWCLDNGHGGLSAGKRSPIFDDGVTQFFEYEFNRDIVVRIMAQLDDLGISYEDLMPDVANQGNDLEERVKRANQLVTNLPKRFLSVHCNAGPAPSGGWTPDSVNGIESWYYYGSAVGKQMASIFQQKLIAKTGMKDRGLKTSQSSPFYVLKKTTMPAVLTENGFYNNKNQALELVKDSVRQKIADAHVEAILVLEGR